MYLLIGEISLFGFIFLLITPFSDFLSDAKNE